MAKTITVAAGPKCDPGQVALWEQNADHPDGEVYIAAPPAGQEPEAVEVARTPEVSKRLSDGRLVEVEPKPKVQPAEQVTPQSAQSGVGTSGQQSDRLGFLRPEQRAALAAAGYGTAEAIRAEPDDAKLDAVPGIGEATVKQIREAVKE